MRARGFKPSLFTNVELGCADPILTLLFLGTWSLADREGRLEDLPIKIKGLLFPYRDLTAAQIDEMLGWLQSQEFIERYEVDGERYIQITNFSKHQRPHQNEKPSEIPPLKRAQKVAPRRRTENNQGSPSGTTKVASASNQGNKDFALTPSSLTPDSGLLTPDPCYLTPDCGPRTADSGPLIPDCGPLTPDSGFPARAREDSLPLHVDRGALRQVAGKIGKHKNGSNGTKSPEELRVDARKLHEAGNAVGDIVKLLGHYHVTAAQVQEWIA